MASPRSAPTNTMITGTQRWLTARSVCHRAGPAAAVPFDLVERSVFQGLAAFRWGAWLWMATVLTVSRDDLRRPGLAVALVAVALAVTVADTVLLRADPEALLRWGPIAGAFLVTVGVAPGTHRYNPRRRRPTPRRRPCRAL